VILPSACQIQIDDNFAIVKISRFGVIAYASSQVNGVVSGTTEGGGMAKKAGILETDVADKTTGHHSR